VIKQAIICQNPNLLALHQLSLVSRPIWYRANLNTFYFCLFTFYFLPPPALCQVIIGKFLLKTKDDTISGLGFQGIWLYTPRNTNGLNILFFQNFSKKLQFLPRKSSAFLLSMLKMLGPGDILETER